MPVTELQNDQQNKLKNSALPICKYQVFDAPKHHKEIYNRSLKGYEFDIPGLTILGYLIQTTVCKTSLFLV